MIEIGRFVAGIEDAWQDLRVDLALYAMSGTALDVGDRQTFAALKIAAFVLVGRGGAAPKEIFSQFHINDFSCSDTHCISFLLSLYKILRKFAEIRKRFCCLQKTKLV